MRIITPRLSKNIASSNSTMCITRILIFKKILRHQVSYLITKMKKILVRDEIGRFNYSMSFDEFPKKKSLSIDTKMSLPREDD